MPPSPTNPTQPDPTPPTAHPHPLASTPIAHLPPGTTIASYTITSLIGLGGMGAVYAATQHKPRRTVALKLIRPGHATESHLRRFEYEAEILGRLQHPAIAQIYEAGVADTPHGRQPFFAMELVRGRPLLAYADEHNLSTRDRLALLADIADAVEHAHQKAVIHRDLKPSNILVTPDAVPKILDFGVARATDADLRATTQTDVGQIIGTIQYMAPEQALADPTELDTRADIYALGVTLYELLTHRLPYDLDDKPIHDAVRIITTTEPTPPSSIDPTLRGDVQTILATALAKEKYRRYPTAAALADDIRRHLDDQPIAARPPSAAYQLRKFARRNKPLVAGAAAVLLALLLGLAATSIALSQAVAARNAERRARDTANAEAQRARTEAARANQVSTILRDMLRAVEPAVARGRDTTILREILDHTAQRADTLATQPLVEASVRQTLGVAYLEIGETDLAGTNLARALRLTTDALGENHRQTATLHNDYALVLREQGRLDEAESHLNAAIDTLATLPDPDDKDLLSARQNLALIHYDRTHFDRAEPILQDVAERRLRTLGPDHEETLITRTILASLLNELQRPDEAEALFLENLAHAKSALGDDHPRTTIILNNLAHIYNDQARYDEAEPILLQLVETAKRVHGPRHPTTAVVLNNLGGLYDTLGQHDKAEPYYREALDIVTEVRGERHPETARTMNNLASVYEARRQYDQAESLYRRALEIRRDMLGESHPETLSTTNNLAFLYRRLERYDDAEPLFRKALEGFRAALGPSHPKTLIVTGNLAELLRLTGRLDEALALHRQTIDGLAAALPPAHWLHHHAHLRHAMTLRDMGRFADAEPELLAAHDGLSQTLGPDHERTQNAVAEIIALYDQWQQADPAASHHTQADTWRARLADSAK